jgi:hypothetical protein
METSVDRMFRQLYLECTFDISANIYEDCILKQKGEFKRFFDLGVLAQFQSKENLDKEEAFEYWYNKYLSE